MLRGNRLLALLRSRTRGNLSDTASWLACTAVTSLLPLWGSAIILGLWSQPVTLARLSCHGELALYSAALMGGTLYLVGRDFTKTPFVYRPFFLLAAIVILLTAAVVFGSVTGVYAAIAGRDGEGGARLDREYLVWISLTLLIASGVLASFVHLLNSIMTGMEDLKHITGGQEKSLEERFDALEDSNGQ